MTAQRHDIQVLRGVAVLAVVAYHALHGLVPGGFLGVDVFFVISGFLIGRIILTGLEERRFSFFGFYKRRAWRLLPASFCTLAVTTVLAYGLLASNQWPSYLGQLIGAATFTSNFVLFFQSDYFALDAATMPLLHIWSLSLEEQFYFVAPAVLAIVGLYRGWVIAAAFFLSLALCFAFVSGAPLGVSPKEAVSLAFYMLPTRAWELLAGTFAAWIMLRRPVSPPPIVKLLCLAVVIGLLAFRIDSAHPRFDALLITLATAVMLLGKDGWVRVPPLARVGDWSYSLYLVHWPLLAFAHVAYLETPPLAVSLGLCALAMVLAWAQYTYVETPFRKGAPVWRLTIPAAALALLCAPIGYRLVTTRSTELPPAGLASTCAQSGSAWQPLPECATSKQPVIALWGDSYAMQLVPALDVPFVQVTKSGCAPIPGVAQITERHPVAWARECAAFSDSALQAIIAMPSVRYVLISSRFTQVLDKEDQSALFYRGRSVPWSTSVGEVAFAEAIRALIAAGKTPIIVGPTPNTGLDAGACNRRRAEGLPILGRDDCSLERVSAEASARESLGALRRVAEQTGAALLLPTDILCREECITSANGVSLYRDVGHLTPQGARYVLSVFQTSQPSLQLTSGND